MKKQTTSYYSIKYIEKLLGLKIDELWKIANKAGSYYEPFDIKKDKEDGGIKIRHIDNPAYLLKQIQ
jgi:hypothetical protein